VPDRLRSAQPPRVRRGISCLSSRAGTSSGSCTLLPWERQPPPSWPSPPHRARPSPATVTFVRGRPTRAGIDPHRSCGSSRRGDAPGAVGLPLEPGRTWGVGATRRACLDSSSPFVAPSPSLARSGTPERFAAGPQRAALRSLARAVRSQLGGSSLPAGGVTGEMRDALRQFDLEGVRLLARIRQCFSPTVAVAPLRPVPSDAIGSEVVPT